jgi:putative radical SAM enzyme (TIGR03279 family)
MRYLGENGIDLHAQIVLCPSINDGEVLMRTIDDLASLHPRLTSVAVVPVVFTRLHNYRDRLTAVSPEFSRELIRSLRPVQREFRTRFNSSFVFLADEFYLRAGVRLPGRRHYGDYPQIEDGVGMVRTFLTEADRWLAAPDRARAALKRGSLNGTVATGELFYPILSKVIERLNSVCGTRLETLAISNRFFGEEITVAGLMSGRDLVAAKEKIGGRFLVVPEQACLKSGHVFLDDLTLEDVESGIGRAAGHGGASLGSLIERARQLEARA